MILVTGGAGYIGSFMTKALLDQGHEVIVFDNLKRGHKEAVDQRAKLIVGDVTSLADLENLFSEKIDAVMHFAGFIAVGESEKNPQLYYHNNVEGSKLLFNTAIKSGVNRFIFSSSAAVYGNPIKIPIPEDHQKDPTSEYGRNKLQVEKILEQLRLVNPALNYACLRYFNAAGASLGGEMGEGHVPETHIIPKIFFSILNNSQFQMFGTDYPTPDGTCVRDYIHVLDLVEAHLLALDHIINKPGGYYFNVGTGKGFSNKEVIQEVEKITDRKINISFLPRRPGDSNELVADPTYINKVLGFSPKYSDLETIVKTAWQWHSKNK